MYKGIEVYKGRTYAEKSAVLPSQVRRKIEYMLENREHLTINGASIILGELCGVLLGLRRSEFLAKTERRPDRTTLLCFRNLAASSWDLGDLTRGHDIPLWAERLSLNEIIWFRLCYTKHKRHRVAHQVVAGPGHRHMSIALWLKSLVMLRAGRGEILTPDSPLLVRESQGNIVPMTGNFMAKMDKVYGPALKWCKTTIHSRRRGFATAAVRCGIHMAAISIAMRHSQGVTLQYVALPLSEKASITTRLAIASYDEKDPLAV